ncbi:hypothetical protein [Geodermatophilus tzadiensis]|nr:hypothetical protein [Geodermatophilus tzadiensis]
MGATALVHVLRNGPGTSSRHVCSSGSHRDEPDTPWLDDRATRPA